MAQSNSVGTIPNEQLFALFRRAYKLLTRVGKGWQTPEDLTPNQIRVLGILKQSGGLGQGQLMDMLKMDFASISDLLSRLERAGFITHVFDDPDRRHVSVRISEQGRFMLANQDIGIKEGHCLFSALTDQDLAQLGELLNKLIHAWTALTGPDPND